MVHIDGATIAALRSWYGELLPPGAEVARVLRLGGRMAITTSQRCFPTKAIRAWHVLPPRDQLGAIATYLSRAGGFEPAEFVDRSPPGADPLWIVTASRSR